jgi:cobalamin synthase
VANTERLTYDQGSHLLGEYVTTNRDYVWLGGIPVAVIDNTINGSVTTSVVNYVHADGLRTLRAVANGAGTTIWQWRRVCIQRLGGIFGDTSGALAELVEAAVLVICVIVAMP